MCFYCFGGSLSKGTAVGGAGSGGKVKRTGSCGGCGSSSADVSSTAVVAQPKASPKSVQVDREILPTWVTPSHYNVNITPDLESFNFSGVVDV